MAAGDVVPTGVRRIGAGTADQVRERSGARVAVIDGKVDLEHPDLDARPGIDCVGDEGPPPAEPDTHGTHVAGIIDDGLPQDVIAALLARDGTVHSYTLFTGYLPARMRGDMQAYQVLGTP